MKRRADHKTYLNVGLRDETLAMLCEMAEACGQQPEELAAALLHDLLEDDQIAHGSVWWEDGEPPHTVN